MSIDIEIQAVLIMQNNDNIVFITRVGHHFILFPQKY